MSDLATETRSINDLLTRFFQGFDDKNWTMLRDCLCDEVFTDYSSFRGVPASTISSDVYVEQRRTALYTLDMQHNFLNLRIEVNAAAERSTAAARCNYIVYRFHPSFDGTNDHYFHSYGHYIFAFAKIDGAWKISSIVQRLLRNEGNREIHGAMGTRENTN